MLTPIQTRYNKLGPKLAERLKQRFFEAWYFENTGDALGKLYELVTADHSVSWGGSMTIDSEGVQTALAKKGCRLIDRDKAATPEERAELQRQALLADTFLGSVNAISESGEIVNIDGMGNRVAAYIYGPKQVVLLVGMNKVAKTLEDAWSAPAPSPPRSTRSASATGTRPVPKPARAATVSRPIPSVPTSPSCGCANRRDGSRSFSRGKT
jgi:L-lactate utilization protein LutB